jgi:hypothetical protein
MEEDMGFKHQWSMTPPEGGYIPGYTGHVKRRREIFGKTFASSTSVCAQDDETEISGDRFVTSKALDFSLRSVGRAAGPVSKPNVPLNITSGNYQLPKRFSY